MIVPSYARYDYCVETACYFLESHKIDSYPVDLYKIINNSPYALVPYSEIMQEYNCSLDVVCKCLKSNEGKTIFHNGVYTIAYNDVNQSSGRILFTLAHELGHICLNHLLDFEITEIPKGINEPEMPRYQYKILEREANAFARNILIPIPLYYFLSNKTTGNLQNRFGVTYDAAVARMDLISKDYECSKKLGLYPRFMNIYSFYIDKKNCTHCSAGIVQTKGDYCPICGSKNTLNWGDGNKMEYPLLETYENNKLAECPICKNEETDIDGDFCQICGMELVNKCSDNCHTESLASNARYCPICGSKSTFFTNGILKAWNYRPNTFGFLPDGIDEELPFN